MNKGTILGIIIIFVLGAIIGVSYVSYHNSWTDKNNLYEEQLEVDKVIFDEVWKVIKQQAKVSDQYADKFRENYQAIMNGRYGDDGRQGGGFLNVIQESNPEFDASMYKKLMNTIEAQRSKFTRNQQRLISIHKELKNLKQKFPSSLFLGSKKLPELVTVTSSKTKVSFETGEDNDVDLF